MVQEGSNGSILANDKYLTLIGSSILDMENQIAELLKRVIELETINENRKRKIDAFKEELNKKKNTPPIV